MQSKFRERFLKDLHSLPNSKIEKAILLSIRNVETAVNFSEIRNVKKMHGNKNAFRIRVGEFRIGFFFENNVVEFTRCLRRKEIYRYFP